LVAVFRVAGLGEFLYGDRFLLSCDSDGFVEQSLNLGRISAKGHEEHTAEPVQFRTPITVFKSFSERFRLVDCLKGFAGTIC
jgi:hypothetical protein